MFDDLTNTELDSKINRYKLYRNASYVLSGVSLISLIKNLMERVSDQASIGALGGTLLVGTIFIAPVIGLNFDKKRTEMIDEKQRRLSRKY